jgi:hypothetical protein
MPNVKSRTRLRAVREARTVDRELEGILGEMPAEEVRCRMGYHRWARDSVLPGVPWPASVRAWPDGRGGYRIEDPCLNCELVWRVTETLPGGEMDPYAAPRLVYDADWVTVPAGYSRGKKLLRAEFYRRSGNGLASQIRQAVARTTAEPAKEIRFSGAR